MGFLKHTSCPKCGSSDANAIYSDGGSYCWSCEYTVVSEDYKQQHLGNKRKGNQPMTQQVETEKKSKPIITQEQAEEVKQETSFSADNYRGIRDETYKYFGVRHSVKESTGELDRQYYPVTQESTLVGYKIRELPKKFGNSIGRTGSECDLFGQFRFTKPAKRVVITEGEICQMSAYQMLNDYNKTKGWDFETAVVSPTIGANCSKQVAGQYKFLDQFEKIVLCFDNDKVGKEAAEELVKVLPKGKVFMMNLRMKDANEYLKSGNEQAFLRDFWDMQKYVPVGVLPSDQLYDRLISQAKTEKLPWPEFMGNIQTFFPGGMPLGHICNIIAPTSVGKTSVVNELLYYWIFNSSHKCGIVSMELDAGQYVEALLSRHLNRKLALIPTEEEKVAYLQQDDIRKKANQLLQDDAGLPRFYLLDNRDGSVEEIQRTIEELVISCGCKVIIIDVLQDIIAALPLDEQENFLKWSKSLIKSHGILLVYVNHTRKTASGTNASDDEFNTHGSSSIVKSASVNIMLKRDKMSDDPVVRNKTELLVYKNRIFGITGSAGFIYYDNETHTLHNFDTWATNNMS